MNQYHIYIFFTILAIIIVFIMYLPKEKFETIETILLSSDPEILSNGSVKKTNYKDYYSYDFLYNLPTANSILDPVQLNGSLTDTSKKSFYRVFCGNSKENVKFVGILKRYSDGYHKISLQTKENYTYVCIVLEDSLVLCNKIQ